MVPTDPRPDSGAQTGASRLAIAVLAVAFILNFIGRGMADGFAAFVLPLEEAFGWRRSALTGVVATQMLVGGLVAPLAGWVFDRRGPRVVYCAGLALIGSAAWLAGHADSLWMVYLGSGVLMGAGAAATGMVCAASLIGRWYRTRLSTAIAVAYAGTGSGALVLLPLAQALIDSIGWRHAWQFLGLGVLALTPLCALLPWGRLSHPPIDSGLAAPAGKPSGAGSARIHTGATIDDNARIAQPISARAALRAAWRDPAYWRLSQVFFFTALASYLVTPQVVALLIEGGLAPLLAASAYGLAGLLSTLGIVSSGWMTDRIGHRRTALVSFVSTTLGLAGLLVVAATGSMAGLALYVGCFGVAQGARGPIVSSLSNRIFAGPGVATIYGTIFGLMAFGAAFGAWAGGLLHDLTNAYWPVALVSLASLVAAAAPFRRDGVLMRRVQMLGASGR